MTAQLYAGIGRGLAQTGQYIADAPAREARLGEAKARQQQAELELQEYQAQAPLRQSQADLAMAQTQAATRQANAQALNSSTVSAFDRFEADNNIRHLNVWLSEAKKNPIGQNIYGEVARYDSLVKTEANDKLLRQAGYIPDEVYGDPELAKDLIVVTQNTGEQSLLAKETMYAVTGYNKYLTDQQMQQMERQARVNQLMRQGVPKHRIDLEEQIVKDLVESGKAETLFDAYKMVKEMEKAGNGRNVLTTAEERAVERIMKDENIDYLEALGMYYKTKGQGTRTTNEAAFIEDYMQNNPGATYEDGATEYRNLTKTTTQKELADVSSIRAGLDEMNWLETSVGEMPMTERAKVYRDYIGPLEDLRGFKLSTEDKRTIRNLRELTALGQQAGTEITEEETGLIDSTLNNVKKYLFDEVGGKKGTAAYETFRNVFRNALYGATLTGAEIKAFNKAAGSLGQQLKPALAQLQIQMETIKSNLESIRDLNDPDIAHYYTGQSIEDIDRAIEQIEARLEDPALVIVSKGEAAPIEVQRVTETAEPEMPTTESVEFDFDAAMQEEGF